MQVVGVHDVARRGSRAGATTSLALSPPRSSAERRAPPGRRASAESRSSSCAGSPSCSRTQPHQVLDDALLAARDAVAVVQERGSLASNLDSLRHRVALRVAASPDRSTSTQQLRPQPRSSSRPARGPRYLEVALALDRPAGGRRRRGGDRRRRRRPDGRSDARSPSASARATSPIQRPLGLNACAQHRRRACSSGELRRVRRRRRRGRAGLARRRCSRRPAQPPRAPTSSPGRSRPRLEGPRAAFLRPRGAADHDARPRRARTATARASRGARTWRSAAPRSSASAPSTRRSPDGGDEQEWQERLRAAGDGREPLVRRRARPSTTAAPATTRACARSMRTALRARPGRAPLRRRRGEARRRWPRELVDARRLPRARRARAAVPPG